MDTPNHVLLCLLSVQVRRDSWFRSNLDQRKIAIFPFPLPEELTVGAEIACLEDEATGPECSPSFASLEALLYVTSVLDDVSAFPCFSPLMVDIISWILVFEALAVPEVFGGMEEEES